MPMAALPLWETSRLRSTKLSRALSRMDRANASSPGMSTPRPSLSSFIGMIARRSLGGDGGRRSLVVIAVSVGAEFSPKVFVVLVEDGDDLILPFGEFEVFHAG